MISDFAFSFGDAKLTRFATRLGEHKEVWGIQYDREDKRSHPGLFNGQAREFGQTGGVTTPQFLMLS